jgi:UDP-2,3-diacylglucosamine pyrophosphatase LpxH
MKRPEAQLRKEIIADIQRLANSLGRTPSRDYFKEHGQYSEHTLCKVFESYVSAVIAAGLPPLRPGPQPSKPYDTLRDPAAFLKLTQPASIGEEGESEDEESAEDADELKKKFDKMSDSELSEHIAELIEQCGKDMKREPQDLTWYDFREHTKYAWGKSLYGIIPRVITRVGGFNIIRDAYFPPTLGTEQSIEKSRLREHALVNRRLGSEAVRREFLYQQVEHFAQKTFGGKIQPVALPKSVKPGTTTKRILTCVLSDLHFGTDLKKEETGYLTYGPVEEARRLAKVMKQVCDYKLEYRSETELELLLLGDIIQGDLHDKRDGAVLSEQICRAVHLLSQAIALCASQFKSVRVRCATGNHGRITSRHFGRATFQKFDSHETVIYYSIKMACSALTNVEFDIPKMPYTTYTVFGKKIFITHGDTVLNPGNPGRNIQTASLESQINRINASLHDKDEYSVVIVGHVHVASMTHLNNGTVMISNAALIPADNFAVSIGILESNCGQWIFESVENYPVGDSRLIKVGKETDEDESLDEYIKPWAGY